MVALAIVVVGFLGAYATALHAERLACSAEEAALVLNGIEQRVDQLRLLSWAELTGGNNATFTNKVWKQPPATAISHPEATLSIDTSTTPATRSKLINVTQEQIVISAADTSAQTVTATWVDGAAPTTTVSSTPATALSTANLLRVEITIAWTGPRPNIPRQRTLVTYIAKGGLSKYAL